MLLAEQTAWAALKVSVWLDFPLMKLEFLWFFMPRWLMLLMLPSKKISSHVPRVVATIEDTKDMTRLYFHGFSNLGIFFQYI